MSEKTLPFPEFRDERDREMFAELDKFLGMSGKYSKKGIFRVRIACFVKRLTGRSEEKRLQQFIEVKRMFGYRI